MSMRTSLMTAALALPLLLSAAPRTRAQTKEDAPKDGEAQALLLDAEQRPTLKFTNQRPDRQGCGFYVVYAPVGGGEEGFAARVSHMHARRLFKGMVSFHEQGWLYVTPTRVIFKADGGGHAHSFEVPRAGLKEKPVTPFSQQFAGMQINLREKLPDGNSDQPFGFLVYGDRKCRLRDPEPYMDFLARTVRDFDGAVAEFKRLADALEQAGKVERARPRTPTDALQADPSQPDAPPPPPPL